MCNVYFDRKSVLEIRRGLKIIISKARRQKKNKTGFFIITPHNCRENVSILAADRLHKSARLHPKHQVLNKLTGIKSDNSFVLTLISTGMFLSFYSA